MFESVPHPRHQKISTEQGPQVLPASLVISTCAEKDPPMHEFFNILNRAGQSSETLTNGGFSLETVLNTAQRGTLATSDIITPSIL